MSKLKKNHKFTVLFFNYKYRLINLCYYLKKHLNFTINKFLNHSFVKSHMLSCRQFFKEIFFAINLLSDVFFFFLLIKRHFQVQQLVITIWKTRLFLLLGAGTIYIKMLYIYHKWTYSIRHFILFFILVIILILKQSIYYQCTFKN